MTVIKCNCCGKAINNQRHPYGLGVHKKIGYGSKFDGQEIEIDLCCNCLDKLLNLMIKKFKYNPLLERKF